jgi:hypothetical protein
MKYAKYSEYEIKENKQGERVVIPKRNAHLEKYNLSFSANEVLIDLLNTGRLMKNTSVENAEKIILDFVNRYGLLGAIAELPLNKDFYNHELVFIDDNLFMASGVMTTEDFENLFFTKGKPKITKSFELEDYISAKNYSESVSWIAEYINELYEILLLCEKYKTEPDAISFLLNDKLKTNIRYGLSVTDKIQMEYEFNSLIAVMNFTMATLLSDDSSPLKICKQCNKAFISQNKRAEFCSLRCRNQFNVYKSRAKSKANS